MRKERSSAPRITRGLWAGLAGVLLLTARVSGQAETAADDAITPAAGPWMVCAASYVGDSSGKLAHDLVAELRQRYRLPAYCFNRGAAERQKQQDELDRQLQRQRDYLKSQGADPDLVKLRHRVVHVDDQYAVLIGGYRDIDTARKALDMIRKLPPPQSVPLDVCHQFDPDRKQYVEQPQSPFVTAFVVRNPSVPNAPGQAADPFLKQLNAYESYSLLKCPKPYTLVVKEFQGAKVISDQAAAPSFWDKFLHRETGTQLEVAGQNAHNLAEGLRKANYEAYVLHTRYSSVVTVGSFDGPDDPHINEVAAKLGGAGGVQVQPGQAPGADAQKISQQLQLVNQPHLMPVPRP